MVHPPTNGLCKITDHQIEPIVFWNIGWSLGEFPLKDGFQVFLEIPHEHFPAFARQNPFEIALAVPQVIKDMRDFCLKVVLLL